MKVFFRFCFALFILTGLLLYQGMQSVVWAEDSSTIIIFLGDSITAGLGVEPENAYPVLVSMMLKEKGIENFKIINGKTKDDDRETMVNEFIDGKIRIMITKPRIIPHQPTNSSRLLTRRNAFGAALP